MTNSQRLAELRKKRKEEEKNSSSTSKNKTYKNSDRLKKIRLERNIGFDTFESDLNSLGTTVKSIYEGWQPQDTMSKTKTTVEAMQARINAYQDYQKMFGGADLSELANSYKSVLKDWDTLTDLYKQYDDAESYTKEKTKISELNAMSMEDIEPYLKDKKKNIAYTTIGGQDITWQSLYDEKKHKKMSTSKEGKLGYEDFVKSEKEAKEKAEKEESEKSWWENALVYLGNTPDSTLPGSEISIVIDNKRKDNSYQKPSDDWTQEELNVFGAYWYNKDYEGAYNYAANLNNTKAMAEKNSTKEKIEKSATSGFWAGVGNWAGSILTAPFGLADYLDDLTDIAAGRDVIVEEGSVTPFEYSQTVNSSQSTALNDWSGTLNDNIPVIGGKGLGDVYGLGTNVAQSALSAYTLGPAGIAVSYFGQSAASGVDDALSRGATPEQALIYGSIAGSAEAVSEYIGAERLLNIGSLGIKNAFFEVLKQSGAEGIEETFSATVENIADNFVMQDKSAFNIKMRQYISQGLSEEKAIKKAWTETVEEIAYNGLSGFVSGGLHSIAPVVIGTAREKNIGSNIRNNERIGDMLDVASLSPQESTAYAAYTKYAQKGITSDNVTDKQLGKLYNAVDTDARKTLSSKKTSVEQKTEAIKTLDKLSKVNTENIEAKRKKELNVGDTTTITSTGNSTSIEGIKLSEDKTTLITNDGEVSIDDITLSDKDADLVIRAESIGKEYGEEMGNLFLEQYDGETDIENYATSFNLAMEYTKHNFTEDMILENRGVLSTSQVQAIYNATVHAQFVEQDNKIKAITEKQGKSQFIVGTFDDSIIDYNNTTSDGSKVNWKDLEPSQRSAIKFAQLFSKATGVNIKFIKSKVQHGKHKGKNGSYDPATNTIEIDVYAGRIDAKSVEDSIIPTLAHEMTHWMKHKASSIYESIREDVMKTLANHERTDSKGNKYKLTESELVSREMDRIKRDHPNKEVTPEEAIDELVARACEDMLSNSNAARKLLAKMDTSEQQGFIEKVKETFDNLIKWINDLLAHYKSNSEEAKILSEYKNMLKKISKQWDEMLRQSIQANQSLQKEGITGEELAKSASEDVKYSHRNVEKGKKRYYNELNSLAMQWANSAGTEQGDYNSIYDSKSHKWCLAVADKNSDGGYRIVTIGNYKEVKELEQIYNAENEGFDRYAETYESIKRTSDSDLWESPNREMFGRNSRATNPTQEGAKGNTSTENAEYVQSDNRKTSAEIKRSDRDTLGNTLTEAQQSYFAESKVRDENGNLKVMYHGTPNATFTKFRSGTYFTEHKWYADKYQNQSASSLSYKKTADNPDTYAVYLDIKKPFDTRNPEEARIFNEEYFGHWGMGTPLMESGLPDWLDGGDLQEFLEEQGYDYDGLILDEGSVGGYGDEVINRGLSYVVFSPEQVKSVENKTPTNDSDYRFSMRENVEETKDLVAVHNLSEEKLLKSLQLGGLPMPSIAIIKAKEGHNTFGNISLVFNKETIDPQFMRANKVYSGDAWTPTYPRVEHKVNDKAQKKIANRINNLVPEEVLRGLGGLHIDSYNLEQDLNRHNGNLVEMFRYNTALKYAFLTENGVQLELPNKFKPLGRYSNRDNAAIIRVAENVSEEKLRGITGGYTNEQIYEVEPEIRKAVNGYLQEKYKKLPKNALAKLISEDTMSIGQMFDLAIDALNYLTDGIEQEVDYYAARDLIDKTIDAQKYESWIKELFADIVEKEGIRNNKDMFTPSGNRRSFEALHYEHNLENVIKAMKEDGTKGIGSFGRGNIFGASTTEYGSIAEIKEDAQNRMKQIPEEKYEEIRKGFSERFFELAYSLPIHKDSFTATDSASTMLVEAVAKFKTKSGMANYLRNESKGWANYSDYVVDDLIQLVSEIRQMPVGYFEAKPQRAVGFDEVATAIIPDSANAELKQKLTDYGIKFVEYESENEESRLKALNSLEDVKFSDRDTAYMDAVNAEDMETAQRLVDEAAKASGYNTPKLYHGSGTFGFTKFRSGMIYATASSGVAMGYNRGQGLGRIRNASKGYIQNDGTIDTAIENAKNVLGATYSRLTDKSKNDIVSNANEIFNDISTKIGELDENINRKESDAFWDYIYSKYGEEKANEYVNVYQGLAYMLSGEMSAEEILENNEWFKYDIERSHERKQIFRELFTEEYNKIKGTSLYPLFRYLDGYEFGDALIDLEYGINRLADGREILITERGSIAYLEEVIESIEAVKDVGIYQLYGNIGNNPLVIDEGKVFWDAIPFEGKYRSTDYIANWAKENGYTSVLFKTVLDPSSNGSVNEYADEYVFFDSEQIKSADPVTYDDNGNVIPLSERFNKDNEDIRYSDRDSEGHKLSTEQSEYFKDSKIRDKKGRLLAVYHGTKNAGFTKFTKSDEIGYFFAKSLKTAQTYSGDSKVIYAPDKNSPEISGAANYKSYLNIKKPYIIDGKGANWNGLESTGEQVELSIKSYKWSDDGKGLAKIQFKYGGKKHTQTVQNATEFENFIAKHLNPEMAQSFAFAMNSVVDENGKGEFSVPIAWDFKKNSYAEAKSTRDIVRRAYNSHWDYDGVIFKNVVDSGNGNNIKADDLYVAFYPNQIKSVNNTTPTTDADIRYSDRDNVSVYDTMGETDRLIKENKKLSEDVERLKERLKLEKQITHGNYFNENQLDAVAAHIRNLAKSSYSKPNLVNLLKGVYSYIATSKDLNWQDMFAQCYDIASKVLDEAKPVTESNDYYKMILRDIQGAKISVNEGQRQNAKYRLDNKWHSKFFNRIKITDNAISLDAQWQEWASEYPDIFDAEISDADQLVELYYIYDSLKEGSEIVVEYDTEEQTRWLAREIYNQYWNVSPIRTTAEKYDKQIKLLNYKHREAMNQLRDSYKDRLKTQHEADKKKAAQLVKQIRERKDKEIEEVKQKSKERMDAYKDNAARKTKIQSITTKALSLSEWLLKNSKEKHIHESLKGPVANLLQAIDFSSKQLLGMRGGDYSGMPTRKDISLQKSLSQVKDMMLEASVGKEELIDLYGHDLDDDIKLLIESVDDIMRTVGDNEFILNKMTLSDLNTLDNMLKTIKQAVTQMNQFHSVHHAKGIASLGQEEIRYAEKLGNEKVYVEGSLKSGTKKMLKWTNSVPYYAFKRFGDAGKKIFEAFQDGWDKLSFNVKAVIDFTKKTYKSKEVKEWEKEVKTFAIPVPATDSEKENPNYKPKTQKVQMTTAQVMYLYLLNKRASAKAHLLGGGIVVSNIETKKREVISQPEGVLLEQSEIDKIIKSLNSRQIAVADALSNFMNTVCSDWGNEVSMARFGYKAFGEPDYVPMQVDKDEISTADPAEKNNSLFKLLNMSFTKGLTEGANNRLVISSLFDVFAQHTSDMAKYNALALPVLDAFKWYNYKEIEYVGKEAKVRNTVKKSIGKAFGKDGQSYITTLLEDINGQNSLSRDKMSVRFFKNSKLAAVGMNLRVVLLQPTSYFRASANIDNKYLIKALAHKPKIAYAEKYCGMALWKSLGYYDTNIQRGVAEQIKQAETGYDKLIEWSMKGASDADRLTLGYLWNASELEIRETRKDLKVGSEEFFLEVGKRLRDIIYSTQVVDSTLTRSEFMRSPDGRDKILSMFASEPTLAYNILQDAYIQTSLDARELGSKKAAFKKNGKKIARAITAYTITNAVAALVESGFDALRDDDDEEMDIAEFMKLYLANFAADMSIVGKIPYLKDGLSILQGYSPSRSDIQWMQSAYYTFLGISKHLQGEGNPVTTSKNGIKTFSYLSGLPFYNAYRDLMATLDKLDILSSEELEEMFKDLFGIE